MNDLTDILEQVSSLPPLPGTAVKLIRTISDPRSSIDDIVQAIKYDQAVTTEVLRLSNSAYFGLARRVTSLDDALLCLGAIKVLQLVMAVHTNSMLTSAQAGYGLEPGVLWRHSVAVAMTSSAVGQRLKVANAGLVFTAGLLHDVGKVVLNQYVAAEFAEIVRRVNEEGSSFAEAEHHVLGFSHEEVGGRIAERWQLPEPIVRCIRYHHNPGELEPPDSLVDAIYVANCVCLLFGVGAGWDGLCYRADHEVMERHGLNESDLELFGAQMLTELRHVEELFSQDAKAGSGGELVTR